MFITGLAHVGIRVHDLERSLAFYRLLGFEKTAGPLGPEPVAILQHPTGIEINLVLNAPSAKATNVLMDVPVKEPGITHVALSCSDLEVAVEELAKGGYAPTGPPVRFPTGHRAVFFRDPDGVVVEINQPGD